MSGNSNSSEDCTPPSPVAESACKKRDQFPATVSGLDSRSLALVTNSWTPCILISADGKILEWNGAAEQSFGWKRAEIMGHSIWETVFIPGSEESWALPRAIETGSMISDGAVVTLRGLHKSGWPIHVEARGFSDTTIEQGAAFLFLREIAPDISSRSDAGQSWRRFQRATSTLPVAIAYFDRNQECRFINDAACHLFQIAANSATSLSNLLGAEKYQTVQPLLRQVGQGKSTSLRLSVKTSTPQLDVHLVPDCDQTGSANGFCLIIFDNSEVISLQHAHAAGARHLKSIADNVPALITYVDKQQHVTFANATFKSWLGIDPAQMVGQHLREVLGTEMYEKRRDFIHRGLQGEQLSFELPTNALGIERELKTTYIPDLGTDGTVVGLFVLVTDISAMKSVERQLDQLARIDPLTQLPNRRDFQEKLQTSFDRAKALGESMAVMFLDLDHFKNINDTYGHAVGDEVLKQFSARLRQAVRRTDIVARLAGDEFVILLEGLGSSFEASRVAEKICKAMQAPMSAGGELLPVTSSVGVALIDSSDSSPEALLERADKAAYEAKQAGRNRFALHPGEMK